MRREVSQLRAVLREARAFQPSMMLRALVSDLDLIARALRQPQAPIIESAADHVVQRRMKCAGMRWSAPGGDAILALRSRRPLAA